MKNPSDATQPDEQPNFVGYFFAMPSDELARFAVAANGLKMGDSAATVESRLGKTHATSTGHKLTLVDPKHNVITWTYVVARFRKEFVTDGKDEYIYLNFDGQDRLESILSLCPMVASR